MIKKTIISILFFSFVITQSFMEELMQQKPLWTGSFGTVSIDGETYNQISLRPEFNLGKWGFGFDFYLYINGNGDIYDDSWKFTDNDGKFSFSSTYKTFIDKLKYVRYGYPGDQLYFQIGTLSGVTLGHGILVDKYSNMMRYPEIRRVGFQLDAFLDSGIGIQFVASDFKGSPSVLGTRINYPILANFDVGVSFVMDANQNEGLDDSDGDGVPDFVDAFPDINGWYTDTDGDGLADQDPYENDIDGDGWDIADLDGESFTDEQIEDLQNAYDVLNEIYCETQWDGDPNECPELYIMDIDQELNPDEIFNNERLKESISGVSLDFTYHINQNFKLYSEFAKLNSDSYSDPNGKSFSAGWGMVPLGLRGHYGPFGFKFEYRKNSDHFVYNYWDRLYDINRSVIDGDKIKTKASQLYKYGGSQGIFLSASGSVYNILTLGVAYQDLKGQVWNDSPNSDDGEYGFEDSNTRNFLSTISLNTTSIPKIKYFSGFYQKTNFSKFDIGNPDQNTVFGFDLGIDFSESMLLVYKSRTSYEPDGQGDFKKINSMFVETQILF